MMLATAPLALANPRYREAKRRGPLTVELVNRAADVPGVWDAKIRARAAASLKRNVHIMQAGETSDTDYAIRLSGHIARQSPKF